MSVVTARQENLPNGLYSKVASYRHKVFVERLGWQLPHLIIQNKTHSTVSTRFALYQATSRELSRRWLLMASDFCVLEWNWCFVNYCCIYARSARLIIC